MTVFLTPLFPVADRERVRRSFSTDSFLAIEATIPYSDIQFNATLTNPDSFDFCTLTACNYNRVNNNTT